MFRRRIECDLWSKLAHSTSTTQITEGIREFYGRYKRSYNKLHRKHLIEDMILMSLDAENPTRAKALMFIDGINLHYRDGSIMNMVLHRGYIYLCEFLLLKDRKFEDHLRQNGGLFTCVLKHGDYNSIINLYERFGYDNDTIVDELDNHITMMDVDLYERLKENFGYDKEYKVDFGKSQVLDLSQFRIRDKKKKNRKDTPMKKLKKVKTPWVEFGPNSPDILKGFINRQSPPKIVTSPDFTELQSPKLKRPMSAKKRPDTSHGW